MPIGPVSQTGRAMMASLQQAMSKGMPVDQAIAYVKGMATQGVAPMTDLYAMLNQFQRLKQPKVQAPQTPPTLKDQLGQLTAAQDVIEQGVGSLPAPAMEQAQFAGGGIIGFISGGDVDPFRPDPEVQRQIRDQAGLPGEAVDDFRRGYADIGNDKYTKLGTWNEAVPSYEGMGYFGDRPAEPGYAQDLQKKWDSSGVPALIRNPLIAPPPGFAGGGIVAFDEGGLTGIDFSKMTLEELDQLSNDADPEVMKKARKELIGRFSSSPGDIASKYAAAIRGGIAGPQAIQFSNERKFPGYMYDEKGNVRKGEVTGGIAGTRFYSSSNPQQVAPTQQAAPAPAAGPQIPANATFDDMVSRARAGSEQTGTPYDTRKDTGKSTSKDKAVDKDTSEASYKTLESLIPKEGTIGEYLNEIRKARGENAAAKEYKAYLDRLEAGGAEQDKQSRNLAIAKAGFAMAEAASRRGRERTGLLGAAAIGGSTYANEQGRIAQQMQARQEKLAEAKFKLADAQRREDTDDIRAAMQEVKANQRAIMQARSDITKLRIAEQGQTTRANIAAKSQEMLAERYAQQAEAAARSGDLRALSQLQNGLIQELKDPLLAEQDKSQLRALLEQIRGRLGGSLSGGPMTTGPQLGAVPQNVLAGLAKYPPR